MASSGFNFAARRAGMIAARIPMTIATSSVAGQAPSTSVKGLNGEVRVRPLTYFREDPVERLVDRVREDERPGDHRDTEHDRDRGERRPELSAQ